MKENSRDGTSAFSSLRRFARILFCLVAILSVVLLAVAWAAPFLAEPVLIRYMERAGIESPEVRVESISPRGVFLSGLVAQNGRITIDFLAVYFSPSGLMRGSVDRILVSGFTWRLAVRDGSVDTALPPAAERAPSSGPPVLPFSSLEISSSTVIVDYEGWTLSVPFSMLLESQDFNGLSVTALCEPLGIPVTINGQGDLATGEVRLGVRAFHGAEEALAVPQTGQRGTSLSGSLEMTADWSRKAGSPGWGTVAITTRVKGLVLDVPGFRARVDEGFLTASSGIEENLTPINLGGALRIEGLHFRNYELAFLSLTLGENGARTDLSARIDSPLRALITAGGDHLSPLELLEEDALPEGRFDWVIDGEIPDGLVLFYSGGMVSTDDVIPFHAQGSIDMKPASWSRWKADITAGAFMKKPLQARMKDMSIHFGHASVEGQAALGGDGLEHLSLLVNLDEGALDIPDVPARIGGISLQVPLVMGEGPPEPGRFFLGQVSFRGIDRPGPAGRIAVHNKELSLDGTWRLLAPSPLRFSADLVMEGPAIKGTVTGDMDWCDLPDQEDLFRLIPDLGDVGLTGQIRTGFRMSLADSVMTPRVEVSLRDLNLQSRSNDLEVEGIAGTVKFESLDPVSTPGNQTFTIDRLRLGAFELGQGSLAFRVENRDRLFLERSTWNLPQGGVIALRATRVDRASRRVNLELVLEDIDIIALLSRLTEEKVSGSGLVYGRIPLVYEQGRVTFERGYVYSVPGTGRVGIRDEQWLRTIMLYVNEAMAGHPQLSLVAQRMEEALKDFEYTYLTMDLKKAGHETAARIELRGKGVAGDPPQEIGSLVLNVNDLDELINRVLGFTMTGRESVGRALEELLDFP